MLEGVVDSPDTIIEDSHCNFGNSFGTLVCLRRMPCCDAMLRQQ